MGTVLSSGTSPEYLWYSGDKVILITGQSDEVTPLLEAYLAKHPSAVEPSFPLYVKALRH